jgi:hypothetical protein
MSFLIRPSILMAAIWAAMVLLFASSPISYVHSPGVAAWSIIGGGAALFCLGAFAGERANWPVAEVPDRPSPDRIILVCAALGFAGIAAMLIDKLYFSGIDWSIGLANVRERRSVEIMENIDIRRSWVLYFGYLTFSFSCVAVTLLILAGERLSIVASICGQASVLPMTIYSVLYGGRMPILVIIFLLVGASATRAVRGKPLVPCGRWLWWKLIMIVIAFLFYTGRVWEIRREINHMASYPQFVGVAVSRWEMQPSPWLDRAIRQGEIPANQAMNWLSIGMYLTHSPTTVQRMVEHWRELSIYGGLYQVAIFSPLSDMIAPSLKLPQKMRSELNSAGVYGWFPSAWGAWIGDFGLIGGAICVFIWGLFSGFSYRLVRDGSSEGAQLMLSFAYFTIFASPLNGPFGVANSFLVFLSFAAICAWLWRPV